MSTLVRHENGVTLAVCGSNFAIAHSKSSSVITHKGGDSEKLIVAAAVSPDGNWAATSDTGKNVFIWDAATGEKVSSCFVPKKAVSISFAASGSGGVEGAPYMLVLGDRVGDVHALPVPDLSGGRRLLFGHTATVVTDVLVSACNNFIVSADRDEKIRLTKLPYGHETESYCLGHTTFVTRVAQSRALPKLLLSSGGEPSVCVWEVPSGKRLHVDTLGLDSTENGAASDAPTVAGAGAGGAGAGASEASGAGNDAKPIIVALAVCGVTKTVAVALLKSPIVSLYTLDAETGALAAAGEVAAPRNVSDVAFTSEGTLLVADEAGGLSLFATPAGEHRFAPVSSVPAWASAMSEILAEGAKAAGDAGLQESATAWIHKDAKSVRGPRA